LAEFFGKIVQTDDGSLTIEQPGISECFHSLQGARSEAELLYIESSGIKEDFQTSTPIAVLDVGLGLGYNALVTVDAWLNENCSADLNVLSLEYDPKLVHALIACSAPWQQNWNADWLRHCQTMSPQKNGYRGQIQHPKSNVVCNWRIIIGDALRLTTNDLLCFGSKFDYIWQDPFSPDKNPKLWNADWFRTCRQVSHDDTKMMTYSVARVVKDAVTQGGWHFEKIDALSPRKRHWLKVSGTKKPQEKS